MLVTFCCDWLKDYLRAFSYFVHPCMDGEPWRVVVYHLLETKTLLSCLLMLPTKRGRMVLVTVVCFWMLLFMFQLHPMVSKAFTIHFECAEAIQFLKVYNWLGITELLFVHFFGYQVLINIFNHFPQL